MAEPNDLFEFVEDHQEDISALTHALHDFLKIQLPNPYVALASLSDIVGYIIKTNFRHCKTEQHLEKLTQQTLEAYTNTILSAAEDVIQERFKGSFNRADDQDYERAIGSC